MKCANPHCNREEKYFRSGTLHMIDCDPYESLRNCEPVRQKVVWLCESCSQKYRVQTWRPPGEQIHARGQGRGTYEPPHAEIEAMKSAA